MAKHFLRLLVSVAAFRQVVDEPVDPVAQGDQRLIVVVGLLRRPVGSHEPLRGLGKRSPHYGVDDLWKVEVVKQVALRDDERYDCALGDTMSLNHFQERPRFNNFQHPSVRICQSAPVNDYWYVRCAGEALTDDRHVGAVRELFYMLPR